MSLIDCPECQKEVSSSAFACPHCGYPLGGKLKIDHDAQGRPTGSFVAGSADAMNRIRDDRDFTNLLMAGNKIGAIKRCRELTGLGLKESKELVEQVAQMQGITLRSEGGCFIATACYDSPYAAEVALLQDYRDRVLLNSIPGKVFVKCYYAVSPPLAAIIARSGFLKKWVRACLISPIVRSVSRRM